VHSSSCWSQRSKLVNGSKYESKQVFTFILASITCQYKSSMTLVCKTKNASLRVLNVDVSKYPTTIEGVYKIYTYNIGIYTDIHTYSIST